MQINHKHLRKLGHTLHPLVTIASNGLSESVVNEIQRALNDHELIKLKLNLVDRQQKQALIKEILDLTQATLIQTIGHIALIYRHNPHADARKSNVKNPT